MAEVESLSNGNGKHALEDLEAPIKTKMFKGENGQSLHTNGNTEPTVNDEDNNSTSAATAGDLSQNAKGENNSVSNKYEFSESEVGENSNCDLGTNGDESSRVLDEETTESNGLNGNHVASLNNSNSKNIGENSVDNYGDEDDEDEEGSEEDEEDVEGSDEDEEDVEGGEGDDDDEEDVEGEDDDDEGEDEEDDDAGDD